MERLKYGTAWSKQDAINIGKALGHPKSSQFEKGERLILGKVNSISANDYMKSFK